jgi:hypothetical protein
VSAGFESELREAEIQILKRYNRRVGADRRILTVPVPIDLRKARARRQDDELAQSIGSCEPPPRRTDAEGIDWA